MKLGLTIEFETWRSFNVHHQRILLIYPHILTELRIGEKPEAHNFPARNRIIAGMSDVIIVVEAARKGGALITAEIANSYDRDVFALPGRINDIMSKYIAYKKHCTGRKCATALETLNSIYLF